MKRAGGILAAISLLLLVLVAFGVGWEQLERRRERERLPRIGRAVDIGGRSLNIFCSGQGLPGVIFESDALRPGYSWLAIQKEVARMTSACWYDRAGCGWSDPGPTPHTGLVNAADLHELLRKAGVSPPYVLVADGAGTLNARVYAGVYPGEVSGMVLVDPIDEREERMGWAARVPFHLGYPSGVVVRAFNRVGVMRLMHRPRPQDAPPEGFTAEEQTILKGLEQQPKMRAAFLSEHGFTESLGEARSAGTLGDRPLIVLRSGPDEGAANLAGLSTQGRQVIVNGSRNIQYDAPGAVVEAVRGIVSELRRQ